jgi:hypothetical protein
MASGDIISSHQHPSSKIPSGMNSGDTNKAIPSLANFTPDPFQDFIDAK